MFNSESKGLGLNSCVALRKPRISDPNLKKKIYQFQFTKEHRVWTMKSFCDL